ncbi:MAG: metallophosphoesterase [Chloroflexi bacterium]|nr:metallophosphoesterase [Chloroflexota bacterium]
MHIAVLSDTHDNIWTLTRALPQLRTADIVLHAGDWVAPFILKRLAEGLAAPIHGVFGNNDGERRGLAALANQYDHVHLHGDFAFLEFGGYRIAVVHYPELAQELARTGSWDLVVYGHNHQAREVRQGSTLLLNPGELFGGLTGRSSWALVDTVTQTVHWHEVPWTP